MSKGGKNFKSGGKSSKLVVAVDEMANHLELLKASGGDTKWWSRALDFGWSSNNFNADCLWQNITYTNAAGMSGTPILRLRDEMQTGSIMPTTEAELAKMQARSKGKNVRLELRVKPRKPQIGIAKWTMSPKTEKDGITILRDPAGNEILPGIECRSDYFRVINFINEAFMFEANERVDRGEAIMRFVKEKKTADKATTAAAMADLIATQFGPQRMGDAIMTNDQTAKIKTMFPKVEDSEKILRTITPCPNVRIVSMLQDRLSDKNPKNPGALMANPIARFNLGFTSVKTRFFDKTRSFKVEKNTRYEEGKVDGLPVNDDNVHQFAVSRCTIDGLIPVPSVCYSSMGISIPVTADSIVVEPPSASALSLDDIYGDDSGDSGDAPPSSGAKAAATPAPTAAATAAGLSDGAVDDLVADIGDLGLGDDAA